MERNSFGFVAKIGLSGDYIDILDLGQKHCLGG